MNRKSRFTRIPKTAAAGDRRPTEGEDASAGGNRQVAAVSNVAADTDDQDQGTDGQLSGIEEVNFLSHHKGNTLHANDTKQVDGEATGDGGRDTVDEYRPEWSDEAKDHGNSAGGDEGRSGVVAGDDHQGVVLTIVGASGGTEETVDEVIQTIKHQVQADEFGKTEFLASLLFSQMVHIQADLIKVSGGFRDGGDSHNTNTNENRQVRGSLNTGKVELGNPNDCCDQSDVTRPRGMAQT